MEANHETRREKKPSEIVADCWCCIRNAQLGRRENRVDLALAFGNSAPDIAGAVSPARVHMSRVCRKFKAPS